MKMNKLNEFELEELSSLIEEEALHLSNSLEAKKEAEIFNIYAKEYFNNNDLKRAIEFDKERKMAWQEYRAEEEKADNIRKKINSLLYM
ncbi:MAG: hypothetical protein IJ086_14340 [Clostridium sp.]|nr:hypothetical protein [Clostridium sp.]